MASNTRYSLLRAIRVTAVYMHAYIYIYVLNVKYIYHLLVCLITIITLIHLMNVMPV